LLFEGSPTIGDGMTLVERETQLAQLRQLLADTTDGGHIVLLAGEAGAGKTTLLRTLAAEQRRLEQPVWWGACDALDTPNPLAPLADMVRESVPALAGPLRGPRAALFEAVLNALRQCPAPVLMVIEDAHWADAATLDMLKYLGRRIDRTPAVLVVSYRDDEVTLTHPLRRVLGELPPARRIHMPVPRLSPHGVEALAHAAGQPAKGLHALTRGNAFFVTEVLRGGASPSSGVPQSVQDLVLARYARLAENAQALLRLVAVIPGRTERWLVNQLLAPSIDAMSVLDSALESALDCGLLVADGDSLSFRHELGRVAVESSLSNARTQSLHARVLSALEVPARSTAPARLVHHAVQARNRNAVTTWAPRAAAEAMQRAAYREASAQWRAALEHGDPQDDTERLQWLEALAQAVIPLALHEERLAILRTIETLARARGEISRAAKVRAQQSSTLIMLLRHPEARQYLQESVAMLDPLEPSADHALVWALHAQNFMLDRDYELALSWGYRAIQLAQSLGEQLILERAHTATGAALLFVDYPAGRAMMLDVYERRQTSGQVFNAAMTLSTLGSGAGELMLLRDAQDWLRRSIALVHELDLNHTYARAWLALCLVALGRWGEAGSMASEVRALEHEDEMGRLMAAVALGRLRLRRGDPGTQEVLDEAHELAIKSDTLQRLGPAACVRAEAAFARMDMAALEMEVRSVLPLAQAKGHPWFIGELSYWLWKAGALDGKDAECAGDSHACAEPYRLQIAGQWRAAADAWAALGCPYEQARALAEGDETGQREALLGFEALGARPAAEAIRRQLRDAGVRGVTRGARQATRTNPAGLTSTELKVLELMAQNLSNAAIAAHLHRSTRTVDHHVATVLSKLGTPGRHAAVRRAQAEGWLVLPTTTSGGTPAKNR
jgi:DNA-binding CsgD family transcriptional regulator